MGTALWRASHWGTPRAGRVLKVGGADTQESYSNHAMTGKQLSRLGIAGDRRIAHVHHRVLDIGVPQPVLYERHIGPRVEQMHRDRVAQRMKTPLGLRNGRNPAILLHQVPIWTSGSTGTEIRPGLSQNRSRSLLGSCT